MSITNNALSGALAAQAALNAASQNIANAMTPGYTRQGVVLAAQQLSNGRLSSGDGVNVSSLMRFSDEYKNQQLWQAASGLGYRSTIQPYLTQLEQIAGNDLGSINSGLDGLFGALNAASLETTSSPLRKQVITAAEALAQRFNSFRQVLAGQRASVNRQRESAVEQINVLTKDIASLNQKIVSMSTANMSPSGLVDERDQKIDQLARLTGLQVLNQPDGSRTLMLRDGSPLVVGANASRLGIINNPDGTQTMKLVFATENFTPGFADIGGELGGIADFESNVLAPMTQAVMDMASGVATQVNTQLGLGYSMSGASGKPLFDFDPSSVNAMLKVRPDVLGEDLAFSANASEPGNGANLLKIIDLKDQPIAVTSLGSVLLGDAYTQIVGKLGMDSQQNRFSLDTAKTVRDQADASWKATSGVNNDEEAINLMQFQQMYQANMKVIAVANQLFDATLSMFA